MQIFKNMFRSIENLAAEALDDLISLYSPVYVPILALAAIIIKDTMDDCKANKKYKYK